MPDYSKVYKLEFPVDKVEVNKLEGIIEKHFINSSPYSLITKKHVNDTIYAIEYTSAFSPDFETLCNFSVMLNRASYTIDRYQILNQNHYDLFNEIFDDISLNDGRCSQKLTQQLGLLRKSSQAKSKGEAFFYSELWRVAVGRLVINKFNFEELKNKSWLLFLSLSSAPSSPIGLR